MHVRYYAQFKIFFIQKLKKIKQIKEIACTHRWKTYTILLSIKDDRHYIKQIWISREMRKKNS